MAKNILNILLCLLFIIFNSSCKKETSISSLSTEITVLSVTEPIYLVEESEKNLISIKLPTDYEYNEPQILYIKDFVLLEITEISGETFELKNSKTTIDDTMQDYSDYYINVESKTSYFSKDIISIVFTGLFNQKSAAHPIHLFFTLNFNPQTMDIVKFSSIHTIDDELYNEFSKQGEKQILEECGGKWPEKLGGFSEELCSKESFFEGLRNEDSSLINWYYTTNGLGFSYSVPFVLGNHKEVELERINQGTVL